MPKWVSTLTRWQGWRWAGKAAAKYLGVQALELGRSAISSMKKADSGALSAECAVYMPGKCSIKVSCAPTELVVIMEMIISALSTIDGLTSVEPQDTRQQLLPGVVSVSYEDIPAISSDGGADV